MKAFFSFLLKVLLPLGLIGGLVFFFLQGLRPEAYVQPVETGIALDAVPGTVTVNPAYSVTLTAEQGGTVLESNLEQGMQVEKDQFLLEIDPTDLRLQYESFKAEYEAFREDIELQKQDEVSLQQRREELENAERSYEKGNLSQQEIERRRDNFQVFLESQQKKDIADERRLRQMEVQLRQWQRRLEKTTITAPDSGIVTAIYAWPGEEVATGSAVAEIYSDELLIEAKVNESNFAGIEIGQPARIRFLTYGDRIYRGEVSRVLPNADPDTQQYTVYLDLDEGQENILLPGLTGEVSIIKNRRENTLLVPRRALFGNFVFVVNSGEVELRRVTPGFLGLNKAEVLDGLEEGDMVISDEIDRFRDGDTVRVATERG